MLAKFTLLILHLWLPLGIGVEELRELLGSAKAHRTILVTKVETIDGMDIWLNPKCLITMYNQQPSLILRKVRRSSRQGVGLKMGEPEVRNTPMSFMIMGDDMT